MAPVGDAAEGSPVSFVNEDVDRAAELMIKVYGKEAVQHAERIRVSGLRGFAEAVLQEVRTRLAR